MRGNALIVVSAVALFMMAVGSLATVVPYRSGFWMEPADAHALAVPACDARGPRTVASVQVSRSFMIWPWTSVNRKLRP
jgi:hypothetical protein